MPSPARRTSGFALGVLLALGNVLVISLGMGIAVGEPAVALFVLMFTIIPAVACGATLGLLADAFATRSSVLRFGVFGALAVAVLAALANEFKLAEFVPYAGVPTMLAVIVLERMTRRRDEAPIPTATVR